jgi:signal transduction histidine kinase
MVISHSEASKALASESQSRLKAGGCDPFASGGDMGALMRALDWGSTPVGPFSAWSPALRAAVSLLLRSPSPMMLCWGPRFAQLYNDAYRAILGSRHPRSIGQPAAECWSDLWNVMGPMVQSPFSGGPSTSKDDLLLLVDRKGFFEEIHCRVECGPVSDESVASTGIGGVLATACVTTQQVQRERQLRTLRELAVRAIDASSAEQVCEVAALTLGDNALDVPFVLLYLLDDAGDCARLAATLRIQGDAAPAFVPVSDPRWPGGADGQGWPLARIVWGGRMLVLSDLLERFGALSGGCWSEPPSTAVALPLEAQGERRPQGVLIAGVSPHRELDEGYRSFFQTAAEQIASAVRHARRHQEERRRAERLAEVERAQPELRRLEREHRVTEAARERLAETLRLNELFVAVLGHDLRTPLSAISLGAAILLKRSALRPEDARAVERIASSADRIARMIGQVLDLTRSRLGGGIPVRPERLDLHELARKVVEELKLAHPAATFRLRLDGGGWGEWDPDRLAQVLSNLVGNAVQHGAKAPVTITVSGAPDVLSLSVHNSGSPIPAESMDTIFDAFRAGACSSARSTGLGLGLYITREIVRAHGGSILVRSSESEGTTFTVLFPRHACMRAPTGDIEMEPPTAERATEGRT